MDDYLYIGITPVNEDCTQVQKDKAVEYLPKQKKECRLLIEQLKRQFGEPPVGGKLEIKTFQHDFGPYCEVVCWFTEPIENYDNDRSESLEYALKCESEAWKDWDKTALKALGTVVD